MSSNSLKSSFVGLQNQGATCYLNSLIQTLFLTPEFRKELFSLNEDDVGLSANSKRKKIIVELQKLFARLQMPNSDFNEALSTKSLTNSFGWNAAQAQDQHDINELYNLLLDGIEQQMPSKKKILNKHYKGRSINIIKCQICQFESKRNEDFTQINILLQAMNGKSYFCLNDSLHSMFIENEEELIDENAYFCPKCDKKVFAKKYVRLIKLPSIIIFNLNRFKFDLQSGERKKINQKFEFSKSLNLKKFIDNEYAEKESDKLSNEYDLIGIVVHRGSGANAGHYHAFIRDMNNEVCWKPIKRKKKKIAKRRRQKKIKNEKREKAMAILVSLLIEANDGKMTCGNLNTRFTSMNGFCSWRDSFEKDLGKFNDFLKNNDRFRIINGGKRTFSVCLSKDFDKMNESESDNEEQKEANMDNNNGNKDGNAAHWFDFNDEDISPVFDSEIDDLYDGGDAECPYMVIYRRKGMNDHKWPPDIPSFVTDLLIDEPLDAEEDKQQINVIPIKLAMATKLIEQQREFIMDDSDDDNDSNEKEVIIISDDDSDDDDLVCSQTASPSANAECNGNGHSMHRISTYQSPNNGKKRKFAQITTSISDIDINESECEEVEINSRCLDIILCKIYIHPFMISLNFLFVCLTQKPQRKKRKLSNEANNKSSLDELPNPNGRVLRRNHNKKSPKITPSKTKKKTKSNKKMKEIEYVQCEYLESMPLTKGTSMKELYTKMSEWSGIKMENIQIAKIKSKRRRNAKKPMIEDFESMKDQNIKIKRVPINNSDDIFVWNQNDGNLAEKELKRRQECMRLNVYLLNNEYSHSFFIERNATLSDLYERVHQRLNENERKKIEKNGRFRNVDTRIIYRNDFKNATMRTLGIENNEILRFEAECAPKSDEIVIRYRLKNKQFSNAAHSDEHELYIAKNEEIATLKTMICSKFEIADPQIYELKKAKKNWALHTTVDSSMRYVKQAKFEDTQRIILNEIIDKDVKKINIFCQSEHGHFKIPKCFLSKSSKIKQQKDEDGDILMNDVPKHDNLDIDDSNCEILCTLNVKIKELNAQKIKKAIVECKEMKFGTKLIKNVSLDCLRLSVLEKKNNQRKHWKICWERAPPRAHFGKIFVEFLQKPQEKATSREIMLFVHKRVVDSNHFDVDSNECAQYGSQYEIKATSNQQEKLKALKERIVGNCDMKKDTELENIILAVRDYESHKWQILKEVIKKGTRERKGKAKKKTISPKLFDRDIIGVFNVSSLDKAQIEKIHSNPCLFETEWDRFKHLQYLKNKEEETSDEYNDEPQIRINFDNSSHDDDMEESESEQKQNHNRNNHNSKHDNDE